MNDNLRPNLEECDYLPNEVIELMMRCWKSVPKQRPDFNEIIIELYNIQQSQRLIFDNFTPSQKNLLAEMDSVSDDDENEPDFFENDNGSKIDTAQLVCVFVCVCFALHEKKEQ